MLDLARELPLAQIDGLDISSAQFPASRWTPQNTTWNHLDLLGPIPESLYEKYDVVHVGIIILLIENNDPGPILDNLLLMLSNVSQFSLLRENY